MVVCVFQFYPKKTSEPSIEPWDPPQVGPSDSFQQTPMWSKGPPGYPNPQNLVLSDVIVMVTSDKRYFKSDSLIYFFHTLQCFKSTKKFIIPCLILDHLNYFLCHKIMFLISQHEDKGFNISSSMIVTELFDLQMFLEPSYNWSLILWRHAYFHV